MRNIFFIKRWALRPESNSLETRSTPILKLLFWLGLIFCLGVVFLSKAPSLVRAAAPPVPNLSLTITDAPDPVKLGNVLTYTMTITSDGTADATNTVVTSDLDSHVQFVSASPGCTHDGVNPNGTVTCNLGVMSSGETVSLTITVMVISSPDDHLVANTTTVTSDNGAIDCDAVTTTVIAPIVGIIKTDHPDPVAVGNVL
ncbi:MAG: DUF11 domain-containing protein, partial [Nitrososphaera sp.]|nr:DUF11 domain-containing protein [Nitrososphaera sp.]